MLLDVSNDGVLENKFPPKALDCPNAGALCPNVDPVCPNADPVCPNGELVCPRAGVLD